LQVLDGCHPLLGHVLLREHLCELLGTVIAEIDENHHIPLLYPAVHAGIVDGFHKLVGHILVVTFLHSLHHVGGLLALVLHEQVVGLFHPIPPLVTVHGIEAADDVGDVVIFINFRNDRAKELTQVLTQQDMPEEGMTTIKDLQYYTMTPYDAGFKGVHVLFPKENVMDTLGEYLSRLGKKQLHTAETEKYAHVTFFFNGGREAPYEGEDRILVPSPKVATYDLKPEMSAYEVKDKLVAAIREDKYDFIVVNFANGDMVGHTGIYNAIAKAVWAVDQCVHEVIDAARETGYEAIIIADHGNADNAINEDGTPNTAHSLNPVPFIYVTDNNSAKVKDGRLADVAPSILHIMGLEQPADMTGECLIEDK
jgi:2,3-bisphosphoglycerate-independent phosphoglycerate mutase